MIIKKIFLPIFITLFFSQNIYAIELDWLHDYNQALKEAKAQHKDIYLFVGADKCRFCERFKKETLSNKEVLKKLHKDYVLLYLSRDRHKIPKRFKTWSVPRHYFLTSEGKLIVAARGSREVAGFFDILDEVDLQKDDPK